MTGRAVPLDRSDVDTDQIIPSDWLKRVERTGFGAGLFAEWRDDRDFVLNHPEYRRRHHPGGRAQLRHRLVAGARRVGPAGLRVRGGRLARASPTSSATTAPSRAWCRCRSTRELGRALLDAVAADPTLEITIDVERGTARGAGGRARRHLPARRVHPRSACSTDGTTSASPLRYEDDITGLRTPAARLPAFGVGGSCSRSGR